MSDLRETQRIRARRPLVFLLLARVLLLVLSVASSATARDLNCGPEVFEWVARCQSASGLVIDDVKCPDAVLLFSLRRPTTVDRTLERVEVSPSSSTSFRNVAGLGLSPVGSFDNWLKQPEDVQTAFATFSSCVARAPDELRAALKGKSASFHPRHVDPLGNDSNEPGVVLPYRLVPAALFALAALVLRLRAGDERRRRHVARLALTLAALSVATFLLRSLTAPRAFFHQNGQGPLWVRYALGTVRSLEAYGTGYREIFSLPVSVFHGDPTQAVFTVQAVLGTAIPICTFVIARRLGARAPIAWILAAFMACDPLFTRLAQSESYFATCAALFFMAAALLCAGVSLERRDRLAVSVSCTLAAGFLVAEAARIHPLCWPAAASVPLPLLLTRGSFARRGRRFLATTLAVGAVVLVTTGPALRAVLTGELGAHFLPRTSAGVWDAPPSWEVPLAVALSAALLSRRERGISAAVVGGLVVVVANRVADLAGSPTPWLFGAERALFAPVMIAAVSAWLATLSHRRFGHWPVVVLVGVAACLVVDRSRTMTPLPTDALEAAWVGSWKNHLPRHATVAYVERVESRIVSLPLYGPLPRNPREPSQIRLRDGEATSLVANDDSFYVRTSLCSTPEGRDLCRTVESSASLELIDERVLPARPSMRDGVYDAPIVRVALFRVRAGQP